MSDETTDINVSYLYAGSQLVSGGLTARVTVDESGTALFDIRDSEGCLAPARLDSYDIEAVRRMLYSADMTTDRARRGQ